MGLLPHRLIAKIVTALIADETVDRDITAIGIIRNLLNLARVKSFVLDKSLITSPPPSETFIIRSNKTKFRKIRTAAKPSQKRKFVKNKESNLSEVFEIEYGKPLQKRLKKIADAQTEMPIMSRNACCIDLMRNSITKLLLPKKVGRITNPLVY